jgi:hypothetical protein
MNLEQYFLLLQQFQQLIREYKIKYYIKPGSIEILNQMFQSNLDLSSILDMDIKIKGSKRLEKKTIQDEMEYISIMVELEREAYSNSIKFKVIPGKLLIYYKIPLAIEQIEINNAGLHKLKQLVKK